MKHELDDDSVCIHCGHDACEEHHLKRLGYTYPPSPCPVQGQAIRDRNHQRYMADIDQWPDHDPWN